jgi:type I restriction enzyme S subunit
MKQGKVSKPQLSEFNDEQDLITKKILKSPNPINTDSDNMKQDNALSLPKGWEIKKLGEIGKVSMCKRVFKEDTTSEGDIPFYKIGTFGKSPDAFITKEKYDEFRSKFAFPKKGDILISASGTIGRRVRYDGEPAYFQDSNIVWIDNNEKHVLNDYLYRFYEICNWQSTKGATISRLYNDNLRQIEIPFPKSLSEQQRIVSILDEAFAAISKAKANAEQNLKNAKELFESYLEGVFASTGSGTNRDGWEEKRLGEVIEYDKNQNNHKGLPYVGLENIESNTGRFIGSLEPQIVKSSTFYFTEKHVLYGRLRPYLNKVLLPDFKGHCSTEIFPIKVGKQVSREFLFYWFITGSTVKKIDATWTGARMPRANMNQVLEFDFGFPPLKEQQTIVRQLDALRAETQKLEAVYQQKIANLEELKKSILQKAFNGELKTEKLKPFY